MKTKRQFVILLVVLCCSIGSYGQQPLASFATQQGTVREDAGTVQVCVNVSNTNNIPAEGANVTVSVAAQASIATPNIDYRPTEQTARFTNETTTQCFDFELIQDNLVENDESMVFRIDSMQPIVTDRNSDLVTITIQDTDNLLIGFTQQDYNTVESMGTVSVCVQLEEGQISEERSRISVAFTVLTNAEKPATIGDDFILQTMSLDFTNNSPIGTEECANFLIIDDMVVENNNETFSVQLNPAPSVVFSQNATTVTIQDNDFATIAFDRDEIRVSEGNSTTNMTLDLNVVITRLPVGGLQREVIAAISVYELSATGAEDFILQTNAVTFPVNARSGDMELVQVVVLGDNFIETDEVFAVNISTLFLDIVDEPSSVTVTIVRDGDSICPTLQNPTNGNVEMTNNTVGSIATYSCQTNYRLIGPSERNCTAEVGWSGEDPLCLRMCGGLSIENGVVDVNMSVEGNVAVYTCNDGFSLNGGSRSVCQSTGVWNGTAPTCQRTTEAPTNTPTTPADVESSNSRSVGIGVGVAVAIIVVIAIVVAVVVVILVLFKVGKARKRYIVNEGAEGSSSPPKTEITFEDASTLNRYLPDIGEEQEVTVVNGGSKENLLEDGNENETSCTDC